MINPLRKLSPTVLAPFAFLFVSNLGAATDISNAPLATSSSSAALPNVMFILDDSGSMASDYLPDEVNNSKTCKQRSDSSTECYVGDPPYYATQFNTIYYNPTIRYDPAVYYDGTNYANQSDPTKVLINPFTSSSKTNLTNSYPERVYCKDSSYDPSNSANYPNNCRRNGYLTTDGLAAGSSTNFYYPVATTSNHGSNAAAVGTYPDGTYDTERIRYAGPFYYTIGAREYCSDRDLTTCVLSGTPTGTNTYPAPVRWCTNTTNANNTAVVTGASGGTARCQAKYDSSHTYPRFGLFSRVNIISGNTYPKASTRTDCAGSSCTYGEEITNFGNWYAYYRTRMQMMKTAAGRGFGTLDDRYRVGFITINPGSPVSSSKYLKISKFDSAHKQNWYNMFYSQAPGNMTPLREALSRVGRHFAGKKDGINQGMNEDPVQYSCQQNFAILTTDGYWNNNAGQTITGGSIGNQDNVDTTTSPKWSARSNGTYDGGLSGSTNSLADVALYYYKTDLRPSGSIGALGFDVSKPNVPVTPKDFNPEQHMTTFTLGLVDGTMTYKPDYESATTPDNDFYRIRTGDKGCAFSGGAGITCNWPVPASDTATAIDDLWHAAVNGRGTYYSARDPKSLSDGIAGALVNLGVMVASASASATSSPNITPTDNAIFSATYTTVEWAGEVVAQSINTTTGLVIPAIKWSAQSQLDAAVGSSSDARSIYMRDSSTSNGLKPFKFSSMNSTEQNYFKNKCSTWSQCISLSGSDQSKANDGNNLVDFLRGQTQYEATLFRDRTHVLGDTVNANPVYVREPMWSFADYVTPPYGQFKSSNASRKGMLYVAANDGMLHAFDGNTGAELWAYVPSTVLPELYKLAEETYPAHHKFFVDGSPEVMDVFDGGAWRTILVGGLNSGGRGYYALDITDPLSPKSLWEFCNSGCSTTDTDLGLTYGNPVIGKRASDGKWVVLVTSGHNNTAAGDGKGYLYVLDALTGAKLNKVGTGAGSTSDPSGLARIAAWADDFMHDNTIKYVYSGDLKGNVWRFDLTAGTPSVQRLATLVDGGGRPQPVTARPELGLIDNFRVVHVGTGRYLGISDLNDPASLVPPSTDAFQQSLYTFKDKGIDYGDLRNDLVKQDIVVLSPTTRTTTTNTVNFSTQDGWYVDFNPGNGSPGERVNLDPQLVLGTLIVITNVPNTDACSLGGDSWVYYFDYKTGQYVNGSPSNLAGSKISNAITVGAVIFQLPKGDMRGIYTDAPGEKHSSSIPVAGGTSKGRRTAWRELIR